MSVLLEIKGLGSVVFRFYNNRVLFWKPSMSNRYQKCDFEFFAQREIQYRLKRKVSITERVKIPRQGLRKMRKLASFLSRFKSRLLKQLLLQCGFYSRATRIRRNTEIIFKRIRLPLHSNIQSSNKMRL